MTKEELTAVIQKGIEEENKENGGGTFFERASASFHLTSRQPWYTIQIVQQLPEEIAYPKKSRVLVVNSKGISIYNRMFGWDRILLTGLRTNSNGETSTTEFVIGLTDGQVLRTEGFPQGLFETYDMDEFGHLVELYRCKYELEKHGDPRLK
jgi:hypothetical protein